MPHYVACENVTCGRKTYFLICIFALTGNATKQPSVSLVEYTNSVRKSTRQTNYILCCL